MIGVLDKIVISIEALSEPERRELFKRLGVITSPAEAKAPAARKEPEEGVGEPTATATGEGRPKRKWGGTAKKAYWLRTITGFDESAKRGFRLIGDWVDDPKALKAGTPLALGYTDPEEKKVYAIVTVSPGKATTIRTVAGEKELKDVATYGSYHRWEEFEKTAKSMI